jgi:hypothetical protein
MTHLGSVLKTRALIPNCNIPRHPGWMMPLKKFHALIQNCNIPSHLGWITPLEKFHSLCWHRSRHMVQYSTGHQQNPNY